MVYPNDRPVSFVPGVHWTPTLSPCGVVTVVDTTGCVAHDIPPGDPHGLVFFVAGIPTHTNCTVVQITVCQLSRPAKPIIAVPREKNKAVIVVIIFTAGILWCYVKIRACDLFCPGNVTEVFVALTRSCPAVTTAM